ncbi:MAG: bifunctional (p)ppGpp synthetase/guanosine-3',5'-bis(diphosphate) 3'-pyrophosphohydrolase [Burkholderiales bacterium]|nr:bifunctional (p)ppGpp synthetase/guanosine-3',5'-bis(diphosphate) 3'-pyrophosphohydrolase [Burkholderiales bacterium]
MKTGLIAGAEHAAPIVALLDADVRAGLPSLPAALPSSHPDAKAGESSLPVPRARAFAEPLLSGQPLDTGEEALAHADGVAAILAGVGAAPTMQAAAYLVYAGEVLTRPEEVVGKAFGESYASLVAGTRRLVQVQRAAREGLAGTEQAQRAAQLERVRKMLLAFSRDLRVVLLRLASRLQTLRWFAAQHRPCPAPLAQEALQVFAPLANRLGIWQVKWEIEDLALRFLQPETYHRIARQLDEKRTEREAGVAAARAQLAALLAEAGIRAEVQGRPKHIYSILKKMQGKGLDFARVLDVRALRVIVDDVDACYAALARVHERWAALPGEFDDYIARPKPNGYRSLHTVVRADDGRPLEVQIRTRRMHEDAEVGVAAHWAYKEAGTRGYAGVSAAGAFEERVAAARKAVLRQLLAWERDLAAPLARDAAGAFDDRIYVFTPQAAIVELPAGATPLDFAYALHTELGHRCRGARVDGAMVPLTTALASGQTVEITAAKEGGPSLDWLNPEAGMLRSPRARAKVRAWFHAQQQRATIARGRELVEKLLQREGRTAVKLERLAEQLGFGSADKLFEVVGKDEYSLRHIEQLLRPAPAAPAEDDAVALPRARSAGRTASGRGGVLVVGIDSLLTSLARCCRPAPPDSIGGFVTRGKGVAVHRADCSNFVHMAARHPERVVEVDWGAPGKARDGREAVYALDVQVEASDRPGLLRDLSEVFAKERMHVIGISSHNAADTAGRVARMNFTVEAPDAARLQGALGALRQVPGVRMARRR